MHKLRKAETYTWRLEGNSVMLSQHSTPSRKQAVARLFDAVSCDGRQASLLQLSSELLLNEGMGQVCTAGDGYVQYKSLKVRICKVAWARMGMFLFEHLPKDAGQSACNCSWHQKWLRVLAIASFQGLLAGGVAPCRWRPHAEVGAPFGDAWHASDVWTSSTAVRLCTCLHQFCIGGKCL